jgi:hypothetical protein
MMKKIIIFLGCVTIIIGISAIVARIFLGDVDDPVENNVKYIVITSPQISNGKQEIREKTEYPDLSYTYLKDTTLNFYDDGSTYVERTGEFQFFIDEDCKTPIHVDPVFLSSEIINTGKSYAVLAEDNRILYFPVGKNIPHLITLAHAL